jgi:hypothetical protein
MELKKKTRVEGRIKILQRRSNFNFFFVHNFVADLLWQLDTLPDVSPVISDAGVDETAGRL